MATARRSTSATWWAPSTSATCSTTSSRTTRCTDAVDAVYGDLQERPAVVVADGVVPVGVLTRSDLLDYLARGR